jgi:futalosine hydrolase
MNSKFTWKYEIRTMNVLLVAATEFEIESFIKKKKQVDILVTGVGIPATVFHLTKKLIAKNYDLAIQAGIAGTFSEKFNLAEVALVKEDCFGDIGIEENGELHSLFDNGFLQKNEFPFSEERLINSSKILEENPLPKAKAVTINKISDDTFQNKMMHEKFRADIETMEGAAFHYVCLQQKINFLQLRSISNRVGERDKSKWKLKTSIDNLNQELIKIIDLL